MQELPALKICSVQRISIYRYYIPKSQEMFSFLHNLIKYSIVFHKKLLKYSPVHQINFNCSIDVTYWNSFSQGCAHPTDDFEQFWQMVLSSSSSLSTDIREAAKQEECYGDSGLVEQRNSDNWIYNIIHEKLTSILFIMHELQMIQS